MQKIKKVVIPVAGKGTRFLPITKTISKTLLPIIDRPVIHYLLEEAIEAGIEEALIIIGSDQNDVVNYFNMESNYVNHLSKEYPEIENIRNLKSKIRISYVFQEKAKGLGDAIRLAKAFAGKDDIAVILGDDFVFGKQKEEYGIATLCKYYEKHPAYYLGVQCVPYEETHKYGIVSPEKEVSDYFRINGIIEKPQMDPPSNMACVGRYILKNTIFDYLSYTHEGVGGEIQLTDALALAQAKEEVYASTFLGKRFDVGSKVGYVEATLMVAKYRDDLKNEIISFLNELQKEEY
ncbi:MAG: UTP--glucose-1-phosphate uridylyltransferase [Prevotella sp.]|nr:UTP--glucose-1-phosphate uridylyltransferase [Staphylococcus sp.]MCM1351012.1 UTP--glucose-1-phosphate uridylyltransferase [Prevotella sp.]